LACARIREVAKPRVLIGGLGMGFTLRAALAALGPEARVEVAELVPAVAQWAEAEMAEVFAGSLADPRVRIEIGDVARLIGAGGARYDAILLDVDNGPDGLTREGNDRLYDARGLAASRAALRAGGVLAVWSAAPDRRFARRLRDAGFGTEEVSSRARGARGGARHVIWLATRPL
jgi:spermidine synthase